MSIAMTLGMVRMSLAIIAVNVSSTATIMSLFFLFAGTKGVANAIKSIAVGTKKTMGKAWFPQLSDKHELTTHVQELFEQPLQFMSDSCSLLQEPVPRDMPIGLWLTVVAPVKS